MIPSAILGRYARSLAEVVFEENVEDKVSEDLKIYSEIFSAVPDILEVFHSPSVSREAKEKLLSELMAQYPVTQITSNFLRILLEHNRIRYFQQILDSFVKFANEHKGIISARITAAAPLSQEEQKSLENRLAGFTGKLTHIEFQTCLLNIEKSKK